jgi:hypothetical protein
MPSKLTQKRNMPDKESLPQLEPVSQPMPVADVFSEFTDFRATPNRAAPKKPLLKGIIFGIALLAIVGFLGFALNNKSLWIQKTEQKFNAIFLNNGQVYFGTIKHEDRNNLTLDNVFYVQMVDQPVPPLKDGDLPTTKQVPQLVKKGDEFYGPLNTIRINQSQITSIEELSSGSQVLKDIKDRLQQK